jgi:uncharacterized protein YjbJ (UPF0337 family)
MDKQRVNGAIDEVVGSTKRHIGNLTGDTRTEVEGAVQQVKGKVETTVGKIKDGARDAHNHLAAHKHTCAPADEKTEVTVTGDRNIF